MKKSEINAIAERIAKKAKVANLSARNCDDHRTNRKYSELKGMLAVLKVLGVEYEMVWDYTSKYMTGIKIPAYDIDIIF